MNSPKPTDSEQLHTKVTDDILKVIDEASSQRYQVALRLTTYIAQRDQQRLSAALAKKQPMPLFDTPGYYNKSGDVKYIDVVSVEDLTEALGPDNSKTKE